MKLPVALPVGALNAFFAVFGVWSNQSLGGLLATLPFALVGIYVLARPTRRVWMAALASNGLLTLAVVALGFAFLQEGLGIILAGVGVPAALNTLFLISVASKRPS